MCECGVVHLAACLCIFESLSEWVCLFSVFIHDFNCCFRGALRLRVVACAGFSLKGIVAHFGKYTYKREALRIFTTFTLKCEAESDQL